MKPTLAIWIVTLLLGLAVTESAESQRRKDRRARRSGDVPKEQPATDPGASTSATLASTLGLFVFPADGGPVVA